MCTKYIANIHYKFSKDWFRCRYSTNSYIRRFISMLTGIKLILKLQVAYYSQKRLKYILINNYSTVFRNIKFYYFPKHFFSKRKR